MQKDKTLDELNISMEKFKTQQVKKLRDRMMSLDKETKKKRESYV